MHHVCAWSPWSHNSMLVVLNLELWLVGNSHVGVGCRTWGFCRSSQCSYLMSHPPVPQCAFFSLLYLLLLFPLHKCFSFVWCLNCTFLCKHNLFYKSYDDICKSLSDHYVVHDHCGSHSSFIMLSTICSTFWPMSTFIILVQGDYNTCSRRSIPYSKVQNFNWPSTWRVKDKTFPS